VKYYGPKHHKVVSEFVIKALSNDGREFWIYDFDHFMIEGVPFDNSWVAFNRAAGLHPATKRLPNNLSQVRTRGV
jgi:hypothetical protein